MHFVKDGFLWGLRGMNRWMWSHLPAVAVPTDHGNKSQIMLRKTVETHVGSFFFFFNIPCEVTLLCKEYFYFKNRTQKLFLPFLHLPDVSQPLSFLITHLFVQLSTSHLTTYFYNLVFAWELRGDKCHVSFHLLYLPGWCLIKKSCSMYIWAEMYRLFPRSFLS